jgi:hypothetical protein
MSTNASFELLKKDICDPDRVKIKFKNESTFMKILGKILFFNKRFMTNFTTTIGNTIYFPNKDFVERNGTTATTILAHELVHIRDRKKFKLYSLKYLFPQILAIFSILAIFKLYFMFCLLFLAPLPAPWRTFFERRGYAMNIFFSREFGILRTTEESYAETLSKLFVTRAYYFMWWSKSAVVKGILKNLSELPKSELIFKEVALWAVKNREA